jgi:cytochrome P450
VGHHGAAEADTSLDERIRRFDPYDPAYVGADALEFFDAVREAHRITRCETAGGFWILTRHEDALYVLQHPEIFSSRAPTYPYDANTHPMMVPFTSDPPDHNKYRHLLAAPFAPSRMTAMEHEVREEARTRAARIRDAGSCEFVSEFAFPLPSKTFLRMFGIPEEELVPLYSATVEMIRTPKTPENIAEYRRRNARMQDFYMQIARERRANPGEDVLSELTTKEVDGRLLTDEEIANMASLLTSASLDTTASSLSLMCLWLATHPDARRRLVDDPSLIPAAAEELIRYESIVYNGRIVTQEVELAGVRMQPGERVMMLFQAVNRDPRAFDAPSEVRFDRADNRHLGFGAGPHRCIGIHLARMTLRVALEEWHTAIPEYSITPGTLPRYNIGTVRGLESLHLTVDR